MADARDTFHAVKSMSILCLWDIHLTFDRNGVGTYGAYHHKSELKRCNCVHFFFNPPKFAEVSAILEPVNSTRTDYSYYIYYTEIVIIVYLYARKICFYMDILYNVKSP